MWTLCSYLSTRCRMGEHSQYYLLGIYVVRYSCRDWIDSCGLRSKCCSYTLSSDVYTNLRVYWACTTQIQLWACLGYALLSVTSSPHRYLSCRFAQKNSLIFDTRTLLCRDKQSERAYARDLRAPSISCWCGIYSEKCCSLFMKVPQVIAHSRTHSS